MRLDSPSMEAQKVGTSLRDLWSKAPADNDYYQRSETTSPTGVSDHDPPVVRIAIPQTGL